MTSDSLAHSILIVACLVLMFSTPELSAISPQLKALCFVVWAITINRLTKKDGSND